MDNSLEFLQGGSHLYAESQLGAIKEALVKFQQKSDTKAAVMIPMTYTSGQVCQCPAKAKSLLVETDHRQFPVVIVYFYDAPTPSEVFEDFLAIPAITGNVSTRSYSDLVHSLGPHVQYDSLRLVVRLTVWLNIS